MVAIGWRSGSGAIGSAITPVPLAMSSGAQASSTTGAPAARSRATAALSVPRVDSSPAIAMAGSQGDAIEIGPCNRSAALTAFAWIPPTSLSFSANSRATSRDRR